MPVQSQVRRLLFVHQDPAFSGRVRDLLTTLRKPRYAVAHYTHLIDALTYLRVSPVDLVLVGPQPADVPVEKACRKVKAAFPEVPVVAMLDHLDRRREQVAREAGAMDILSAGDVNPGLWARTFDFCCRETAINQELAEVTARLEWLVHTDTLTGLLNRKGMERVIMDQLTRCRRKSADLPVLLIDLDDFNRINATLGHGVGDLVLMAAARRITESVSAQDKVGRCGTDRFVVMLPERSADEAEVVAEKIRLGISRDTIQAGEYSLTTTASLGLTAVDPNSISFDEVLAKAQYVLQRSKLRGKNRVARAATVDEIEMITPVEVGPEMVQALLRGNVLQVSSQPIVNLADGRIVSQEMLIRGPDGPLNRPDNLFRFCQEKDILTAVDLRCLKRCAEAANFCSPNGTRYHVNILPATLLQTPAEELIRVLNVNGNFGHCVLEISEQQLLGDPTVLIPRVRMLQEAGIRIAIDDVGFGNSCLEGLLVLHPEVMKIDKRLIQGLSASAEMQVTLTRLLKVAAVLGAEVVAEGIEEPEDYHLLLELGVKQGQGYLFGRPKPVELPARTRAADEESTDLQEPEAREAQA
jgi:diguanylate cyclase (GGDEF)-like protein